MAIIKDEDFIPSMPQWAFDKSLSSEEKGNPETYSLADTLDLSDDCFACGEKLNIPFMYWSGAKGSISVCPWCAAKMGGGLLRDMLELRIEPTWARMWLDDLKETHFPDRPK